MKYLYNKFNLLKKNLSELHLYIFRRYIECLFHKRKMNILFSRKDDWEAGIRREFRYSQHELTFRSFSVEKIRKYDLIVPLTVHDIKYLNGVRHLLINNPLPIPTAESLELCDDKFLFNQTLIENNFGNIVPKIHDDLPYPYILKKKIDEWGKNSHIIINREQELNFTDELSSNEYFRQYLVPGKQEYATHILFSRGNIVHSVNIEYNYDSDIYIKGKNKPTSVEKVGKSPYLNTFSAILNLIDFEGLCCINYKVIKNQPFIFEINPRFGGSLCNHFYPFMKYLKH